MRSFHFFASILFFCSISFAQVSVIVDAKTEWQSTGISLNPNESILILAKGAWNNSGTDFLDFSGPEGVETWHNNLNNFLVPNVNHMSLVGRIGINGTPFGIGSSRVISSTDGGELFLSMNDRPGGFSDNFGYLAAVVYKNGDLTALFESNENSSIPNNIIIKQNFPNPFNPSTSISFNIPSSSSLSLKIYDINGSLIRELFDGNLNAGEYQIVWDGKNSNDNFVATGTYFYQLTVNDFVQTKKMILLK